MRRSCEGAVRTATRAREMCSIAQMSCALRTLTVRPWPLRGPAVLAVALVVALVVAGASAGRALATTCLGSEGRPCPYVAASIIGQRAEGVLRFPEAVALDGTGDVYVADQLSYVVQKFSAAGAFETQWGSYGGGHGQFGPIGGLATDAAGNVYVVDSSHNRIEKFTSEGTFIVSWGRAGSALGDFNFGSSQNYTAPPGGGIAVAGNYVYVADSGNDRIERFNLEGGEAMAWGTHGSGPGEFSYPRALAANEGEVVVSDNDNHRLEQFSPSGAFESAVGSAGTGPGQFGFPYGVALDAAGDVFVADDINDRVVKLTPQLTFAGAWGGYGSKAGQLAFPRALASDPQGDTYVADTANDRVQVFDPEGNYLRTIGLSGRGAGAFTGPDGLAVEPTGQLLVADTDGERIESFAAEGDSYLGQWTSTGGASTGFNAPAGIAIDPRGSVYVADPGRERVVRLWGDGTFLSELGGPAELGGAQLAGASAVAVAPFTGELYVADTQHNRVLVYESNGALIARWGAGGGDGAAGSGVGEFNHPVGVAVASATGNVYVADGGNNRVVELSAAGAALGEWGARGSGPGRFRALSGIAADEAGRVYVLDSQNNRVEVFSPSGGLLGSWGVRGVGLGEFAQPSAIAVGCDGDVYVADTDNNRVERFQPTWAAGSCVAPGTWPPPLDVAPVVRVSLTRASGVLSRRALALLISCERGCKILARATLGPVGRRGAVPLIAAARALAPTLTGNVRLRVSAAALRRLRRSLGNSRVMRARVTIVAAGPTGRRTTVTRSYVVAR